MNVVPITGRLPEEQPKATHLPLCTVLTPELARCLEAVNSATRALRQAGIPIEQTSVLDRRLFIPRRGFAAAAPPLPQRHPRYSPDHSRDGHRPCRQPARC